MTRPRGPVPTHYDPERIASEAKAQTRLYAKRQREFAWSFIWALGWMLLLWLVRTPSMKVAFARWARERMIHEGPVFIKLGQMLSTRVDAFPPEVIDELAHLQDKVPSFPFDQVKAIIEEDLETPLHLAFAYFEPIPLAAASMGQVHPAKLPSGEDIVVKILRPGLAERFAVDLTLMHSFANWVIGHPWLIRLVGGSPDTPYVKLVEKLGVSLYQQLDLWTEGKHGERFARNFANDPRVSAPAIYWSHSSTRVLAQERIYGYRFDDEKAIRDAGIDYIEIAEVVIRAFTKQVFEDCFFHADSHPGNLFVTPEGNVVYLDFGMVEEIDPEFQTQLVEMFIHVIQQDWPAFLEDMVRADIVPGEVPRDELLPIFTDVWAAQLGFTDKRYTLQEVSDRFYSIVRRFPFRLPERFLFLTRTSASLEGVVYRADPSFKFLPIALPFFAKLVLSNVDVENPWIIQDMLRVAEDGVMFERLADLVKMAVSDEPEAMTSLAEKLVEVALHPKAGPLRDELKNRLLAGGLNGMESLLPESFTLSPRAIGLIQNFLRSREGRNWVVGVLEDPRFPSFAVKVLEAKHIPLEVPLDLIALFLHWFPDGPERQRAYRIIQTLLASPEFPWSSMVDPRQQLQRLQQLQLTGTVPKAEHLPYLLEFLGQRGTLPLLAKGWVKGWTDTLRERVTGPLRLDPGQA